MTSQNHDGPDETFLPLRMQHLEESLVSCISCQATWHSVHPSGVTLFQCPGCEKFTGYVMSLEN